MTYPEVFLNEFHYSYEVIIRTLDHRKYILGNLFFFFFVGEVGRGKTRKGVKLNHSHSPSHATDKYHNFFGKKKLKTNQNHHELLRVYYVQA